jgi:hypothetical protein
VYVFTEPQAGWGTGTQPQHETAKLTASDGATGDEFGGSVGVSSDGSTVVVSAAFATVGSDSMRGAAYVFTPDTSPPWISISRPGRNAPYSRGEVVHAHYACTDPGEPAEVESCLGPVPSGGAIPTGAVGVHSFTVHTSDNAGHQSSVAHQYKVFAANGSGQMSESPSTVSAASAHNTLTFSYKGARGGIWHGALTLTVPASWSAPSTSPTAPGHVTASEGNVSISGRTITVSVPILASGHTLTITYGSRAAGGPGASAPSATGTQAWQAQEKSVPGGALTGLATSPQVTTN